MLKIKMLRDLKRYLGQFITIFLMVFIGVMVYSGIESYMTGMQTTGDNFYKTNNLQDLNVIGHNFTIKDLDSIKDNSNVLDVERKLVLTATSDDDKTYSLSFIESNNISKFYVFEGIEFDKDKKGIWLDRFYALANDLKVGDNLSFNYDGYKFNEEILGLINVPDHLYETKDASELYPNPKEFGFIYLSINELEGYIDYSFSKKLGIDEEYLDKLDINYEDEYIFNNIMVDVDNKNNVSKVKSYIEDNLDNVLGVIKIEDTPSYATYQGEIDEGKTYVGIFSGLFIFIAMLSVITTMSRLVKNQRIQIGTLKALGFSNKKIIFHYISYALVVSILGALLGLVGGYLIIGNIFMNLEMSFFQVPNGKPIMNNLSYICALVVVLITIFVTYITCRKSLLEQPALILRNEIPKVNNKSLNITTKGIFKKLNFSTKWNIRDMFRNKIRTFTAIAGITGCAMLIVCAFGMYDSLNNFIKIQFEDLFNFNYKLTLNNNINKEQLDILLEEYGKDTSQTYMIEFINKDNKIASNIYIDDSNNKIRFINDKGNFIKLNNNKGIYITHKLAEIYNYKIGDKIKWHIMGSDKYYESEIVGFNSDPQNQNISCTRKYYESLDNKYLPNSIYTNKDLSKIKELEGVDLIQNISKLKEGMGRMLSTMKTMICLIIFVAIILGVVIIYNMGILSYTEKQYQFATLKVLGFQDTSIKKIFIKQNIIIAIISIIIGLPLGYFLVSWIFKNALTNSFDFKAHIRLITYIISIIGTMLVTYIVSKILSKKINNIDMVSSLKGNE